MKYTPACIISHFSMNMREFNFMYRTTFALHLNGVQSQTTHKTNSKHAFISVKKTKKCFDRFKLLANETIFKHPEMKNKISLLKGKSTIDVLSNVFLPIAGFGLATFVFLTVISLARDLSQIILVVSI